MNDRDLAALVLTRRYELMLSSFGQMAGDSTPERRVVNDLVSLELTERVADFDAAITTLQAYQHRWDTLGDLVVLDTNFYLVHPEELKDTDLSQLTASTTSSWALHVLVPMLAIDELDRLKRNHETKTRARAALKMLNEVFASVRQERPMGWLRRESPTLNADGMLPLGAISMELLFDPPGHERLPDPDDEIVDRALAVQNLSGQRVTMVTYDQAMSFRARYAGLKEISPPYPDQGEQTGRSRRGRGGDSSNGSTDTAAGQSGEQAGIYAPPT